MLTTTFAAVVLSATLAEAPSNPAWETSYARASETAVAQRKPLAVFIGHGEAGYLRVVGGNMPTEANRVLSASYVALYVNADTAEGKRLAGAFGVEEGLVISSRCGNLQALKYGGPVSGVELAGYLAKYSAADVAVTTTERAGTAVVAPVVGGCPNGRCGTVVTGGYSTGGFSTCPNGRCPNVR